jgi:hypothetical protein
LSQKCFQFNGEDGVTSGGGGVSGCFVTLSSCKTTVENPECFLLLVRSTQNYIKIFGVDFAEVRDKATTGGYIPLQWEMFSLLDERRMVVKEIVDAILVQFKE